MNENEKGMYAATTETAYYVLLGLIKAIEKLPRDGPDDPMANLLEKLYEALQATSEPPKDPGGPGRGSVH